MTEDELGDDQQHRHIGAMRTTPKFNQYTLLKMMLPPIDHGA